MITKEYLQQELAKRIKGYKPGVETTTDNIIAEMKSILVLVDAIDDHEKKYNEALSHARFYHGNGPTEPEKKMLEKLFPELRESEDERMMKNIRLAILSVEDAFWRTHGLTAKEAISYLEKQKAQKPAWWSEVDEKKIHFLSRLIEFQVNDGEYCFGGNGSVTKQEAIEMLQSLRPSWKPSKEQMLVLGRFLNFLHEIGSPDFGLMDSLLGELKEL